MKKLVVLRGTSGSGKTTKAKELAAGKDAVICSADNFFMVDGHYKFDAKLLKKAHAQCFSEAQEAINKRVSLVIIDNTNTQKWEYKKYEELGIAAGYEVEVIVVGSLDKDQLKVYANRNKHGVSLDIIQKQARRFDR